MGVSAAISGKALISIIFEIINISQHNRHLILLDDLSGRYQCTHKPDQSHFVALKRLPP
jgi:hypothetical protein